MKEVLLPQEPGTWRKPYRAITYDEDDNGCFNCTSHRPGKQGYPRVNRGNVEGLHRYVYRRFHGEIPKGLCVMHTCDNRLCINPKHLVLGTIAENNADAWAKGRVKAPPKNDFVPPPRYGEANNKTKLTEAEVVAIRMSLEKPKDLARQYGVDRTTITNIQRRKTWKNL